MTTLNMKQAVIEAIRNQEWLKITFRRKKDDNYVTRVVAPYDVFPQETGENEGKERLSGYTRAHEDYEPGVITIYLEDMSSVSAIGEHFDGPHIRSLIDPKRTPYINRSW